MEELDADMGPGASLALTPDEEQYVEWLLALTRLKKPIAERYASREDYIEKVRAAATALLRPGIDRLILALRASGAVQSFMTGSGSACGVGGSGADSSGGRISGRSESADWRGGGGAALGVG